MLAKLRFVPRRSCRKRGCVELQSLRQFQLAREGEGAEVPQVEAARNQGEFREHQDSDSNKGARSRALRSRVQAFEAR